MKKRFIVNVKGKVIEGTIGSYIEDRIHTQDRANSKTARVEACQFIEKKIPLPLYLQHKIRNYCKVHGTTFGEVVGAIAYNPIVASIFAKKAGRQSIAEKAQMEYIKNNYNLNIKSLPSSGPKALRLESGEFVKGSTPRSSHKTKSIDAQYGNDYICFKWTNSFGGAQDNQANDAINFLDNAFIYTLNHEDDKRFVAILDGAYYEKYKDYFSEYNGDRVIVTTSDEYKKARTKASKQKTTSI